MLWVYLMLVISLTDGQMTAANEDTT